MLSVLKTKKKKKEKEKRVQSQTTASKLTCPNVEEEEEKDYWFILTLWFFPKLELTLQKTFPANS